MCAPSPCASIVSVLWRRCFASVAGAQDEELARRMQEEWAREGGDALPPAPAPVPPSPAQVRLVHTRAAAAACSDEVIARSMEEQEHFARFNRRRPSEGESRLEIQGRIATAVFAEFIAIAEEGVPMLCVNVCDGVCGFVASGCLHTLCRHSNLYLPVFSQSVSEKIVQGCRHNNCEIASPSLQVTLALVGNSTNRLYVGFHD